MTGDLIAVLVTIEFAPDDIIYLCTGEEDIVFEGNTHLGMRVLNVSNTGGGSLSQPAQVSIEILGIELEDRDTFRMKVNPVPTVTLQVVASQDQGETFVAIGGVIRGPISAPVLQGGRYTCSIAPRNIHANNNRIRYWSHEDRVRRFGQADQGMAQMLLFEKREVLGTWPQI